MFDLKLLKVGDCLSLLGGLTAEVVENIGDGEWVRVRYISVPEKGPAVGGEELCHATDIIGPIPRQPDPELKT